MKSIIIYGSTTGNTKEVAVSIGNKLGSTVVDVADLSDFKEILDYDLILLGASTWGIGDIQDDWLDNLNNLKNLDFTGKTVAFFGTGDQEGYPDSFVSGIKDLYDIVIAKGGEIIGFTDPSSYTFDDSAAIKDGKFIGLAIDSDNQNQLTEDRITNWVNQIKKELA
jgi:flavodoxin I